MIDHNLENSIEINWININIIFSMKILFEMTIRDVKFIFCKVIITIIN